MSEAAALNCTSCAAPLPLYGGHRVRSVTCNYCGAVMDAHEGFKAVAQFKDIERPFTPFAIGRKGTLQDVEFTVIGVLGYEMFVDGEHYSWVSSQLFSPTHGYAWITYNNGHVVFSRRVRELPQPPVPPGFKRKRRITFRGETYRLFERYAARIAYAEGELTWLARQGDQVTVTEAVNPPKLFEYEQSGNELEFGLGHYLSRDEAEAAFALEERLPRGHGVHPAQPFRPSSFVKSLSAVGQIFCIVAAFTFVAWAILGTGRTVASERIEQPVQREIAIPFTITDPQKLVEVSFNAPVDNSWVFVTGSLAAANGPVLSLGREISYYHGVEGGERWSEGSRNGSVKFRVPAAGDYVLELETEAQDRGVNYLCVEVKEGVMPLRYLVVLLVISVLSAIALPFARYRFESRRWHEEDDD